VHTIRLSKIFESKIYAMASPRRKSKQAKDLNDALWIIETALRALANIPGRVDEVHRRFLVDLLVDDRTAPSTVIAAEGLLEVRHTPPPPRRRPGQY
jgi:hypothetical protein